MTPLITSKIHWILLIIPGGDCCWVGFESQSTFYQRKSTIHEGWRNPSYLPESLSPPRHKGIMSLETPPQPQPQPTSPSATNQNLLERAAKLQKGGSLTLSGRPKKGPVWIVGCRSWKQAGYDGYVIWKDHPKLGGGFKYVLCSSLFGEDFQFD